MSIRQEMDTFTSVKRMPDFVVADPKSTALIPVPETHLVPVSPAQTAQSSIVFPKENILTASSQLPRRGFIRRVIGNPEKETVHSVAVSDEHAILVNHQFTGNAITRRDFCVIAHKPPHMYLVRNL
ncbi:hypothetical protein HY029_00985 [Candidatus Gottesmanbacteria bacterium]|nr:hypothetical protein [Candidatus Gottesmanbacteria bacterium]